MWSAEQWNPSIFLGHISVSVEMLSGKSANPFYYILNYGNMCSQKPSFMIGYKLIILFNRLMSL